MLLLGDDGWAASLFRICVWLFFITLVGSPLAFYLLNRDRNRRLTIRAMMAWIGFIGVIFAGLIASPPPPNCAKALAISGVYVMPLVFLSMYVPRRLADLLGGIWIVAFFAWLLSPSF
jgi:hypothetical protein